MAKVKFDFNQKDYDYGLNLSFSVDFIPDGKGGMEVLQATISDGLNSIDYADVIGQTSLLDVIKEFMRGE